LVVVVVGVVAAAVFVELEWVVDPQPAIAAAATTAGTSVSSDLFMTCRFLLDPASTPGYKRSPRNPAAQPKVRAKLRQSADFTGSGRRRGNAMRFEADARSR
jgi:hypothetical protein